MADDKKILFAAYGTLRRGERLHSWLEDHIIEDKGLGTIQYGRLHYGNNHRAYPYLVWTGLPSNKAVCEVYELPLNEQIYSMLQMEVNAGYSLSEAEVELADGTVVDALVCSWKHPYGEPVAENDWKAEEQVWL
jgi:gamma-glutamylcyclotransferase (GGCT)/AIG2-like uncharacterized protein YtfP